MQCSIRMACNGAADCFPLQGVIYATAARSPQQKVVCDPTIFFSYIELVSTATEISKMLANVIKDNYEKLIVLKLQFLCEVTT